MIIHVVRPGESVYSIGRLYGVDPSKIISDNQLENPNQLVVGQTLVVLEGTRQHRVAPGQSLYAIARDYGVTVEAILDANPSITNPTQIYPGQIITIPSRTQKLGTIEVNGYALPNIDMEVLKKTLPNLTYLSIFSYHVKSDGSLVPIEDEALIKAAREAGVGPLMVITNIEEEGFSSDLARTIFDNEEVQNKLIENIINNLETKNYYGLDIDFEFIYPGDREKYNNFLRKITNRLHELGFIVSTAVAPKISADQSGLLYEAHDYKAHGEIVDHVIIMTYEWGYTYSPPMAVAPIDQVERVISYAVTEIPSEKILMGIPNYGYNWTLPFVKGTMAKAISNTAAVDLARRVGAVIKYDTKSQSPFYNYYDENAKQHEVWFEDARSIEAKLRLVNQYDLGGVSYWTINSYFPQNWLVVNSLYDVEKVL
ncbi:glycosyl hydrolase family 18 protein [Dethiothermospora halolimnae]|uniref:glycosyl hydrolase family 18 protein n=1 Tax=Dethiothermospora halolimnae TaxID=3114390 RepID=UPI003CCBEAB9